MKHILNTVRLLITHDNYILFQKDRYEGYYFFQGGKIEFAETLQDAARRELLEELAIGPERISMITPVAVGEGVFKYQGRIFHDMSIFCTCEISELTSKADPISPEEGTVFKWLPMDNLVNYDIRPAQSINLLPEWLSANKPRTFFFSNIDV